MSTLVLTPHQCVRMRYKKSKGKVPCTAPAHRCKVTMGTLSLETLLCEQHQEAMRKLGYTVINLSAPHLV